MSDFDTPLVDWDEKWEPDTLCAGCHKSIPPTDIRTQDSEGQDVCLACGDGVKPDNDDPEVFSYA